jgi:hypothetical protein
VDVAIGPGLERIAETQTWASICQELRKKGYVYPGRWEGIRKGLRNNRLVGFSRRGGFDLASGHRCALDACAQQRVLPDGRIEQQLTNAKTLAGPWRGSSRRERQSEWQEQIR